MGQYEDNESGCHLIADIRAEPAGCARLAWRARAGTFFICPPLVGKSEVHVETNRASNRLLGPMDFITSSKSHTPVRFAPEHY